MIKNQDQDQYNMLGGYGNNDDGDDGSNSFNLGLSIGNALSEDSDECLADQPNRSGVIGLLHYSMDMNESVSAIISIDIMSYSILDGDEEEEDSDDDEDDGYFMASSNNIPRSCDGEEEVMMDATSHNSNNSQEEAAVEDKKRSKLH